MANTQFNFELPETEANRLLDAGVTRGMGLNRASVQKSMIARALVMERLEQIAPTGANPPELAEFFEKVRVAHAANPQILGDLEKPLTRSRRASRAGRVAA